MRLEAKDICYAYQKGRPVLSHVNFGIESGEAVGLTAPSGYGKSTRGKILAGYLTPQSGTVSIDGKTREDTGYNPVQLIFQHPVKAVNPRWKMKRILNEAWNPPEEMIRSMGIEQDWMNRWPSELSGGELQRFCVLRALSPRTRFLIADEMTTMLDMITQAQIWNEVRKHAERENMGIVVISHEKHLLERLCGRIVRLDG
jgi:peptide/nickel transport system ATP-binding protein